ncbi:MAG: hypothetical protein KC445_21225, partial [Anaerolineales bacterium]|nr:hypothetical protein [Anaerolineales bacterium]
QLVHLEQRQGDNESAIAHAQRWLALDSLNEPVHRALMTLYAQTGQVAAALRQYQLCQQTLSDELGIAPAAETTELVERIRHGEVRQGDKETGRQGEEENSQFTIHNSQFTTHKTSHNLPVQTTPFIGRKRELTELTDRLANPDTRLVTIIGPGGMGKTRLAQQAGWRLLEQDLFRDGVWFLSLAAVDATTFGPALNPLLNGLAGLFGLRLRGG